MGRYQVRNKDYKGPDLFIVKNVDGTRPRLYWAIWNEEGRYPDVIVELLSKTTEREDLGVKKRLYEQTFHTIEYFSVAPEMERLMGWRLTDGVYVPIEPDERGWLWSKELEMWFGAWEGYFLGENLRWLRLYNADGNLILLPEEAERERAEAAQERAEAERGRADDLAARLAELEAELNRLRGGTSPAS